MSRLAQRIARLARVREERRQAIILIHPDWTGAPGKPMGVIAPGLSEEERTKLLAEAVAEWEAQRKAAQGAQEAAGAPNAPEASPPPSPSREDA